MDIDLVDFEFLGRILQGVVMFADDGRVDPKPVRLNPSLESDIFITASAVNNVEKLLCVNGIANVTEFLGLVKSMNKIVAGASALPKKMHFSMMRGLLLNIHPVLEGHLQFDPATVTEGYLENFQKKGAEYYKTETAVLALRFSRKALAGHASSSSSSGVEEAQLAIDQKSLVSRMKMLSSSTNSNVLESGVAADAIDQMVLDTTLRFLSICKTVGYCNNDESIVLFFAISFPTAVEFVGNVYDATAKEWKPSIYAQGGEYSVPIMLHGRPEPVNVPIEGVSFICGIDLFAFSTPPSSTCPKIWYLWGTLGEKVNIDPIQLGKPQRISVSHYDIVGTYQSMLDQDWREGIACSPSLDNSLKLVKVLEVVSAAPTQAASASTNPPLPPLAEDFTITRIAYSKDGGKIYSVANDGYFRAFDVNTCQMLYCFHNGPKATMFAVSTKEDRLLLSGTSVIALWDISTTTEPKCLHTWNYTATQINFDIPVAFSANDSLFIMGSIGDNTNAIAKFDVFHKDNLEKAALVFRGHVNIVTGVKSLPKYDHAMKNLAPDVMHRPTVNSQMFISCSQDHTARLWDAFTGVQYHTFNFHDGAVFDLDISPDCKYLVTGAYDKKVNVWDIETKKVKATMRHKVMVKRVNFTQNGECCMTSTAEGISSLWNLMGADPRVLCTIYPSTQAIVSPDGKYAASMVFSRKYIPPPLSVSTLRALGRKTATVEPPKPHIYVYEVSSLLSPYFRGAPTHTDPFVPYGNEDKASLPYSDAESLDLKFQEALRANSSTLTLYNAWLLLDTYRAYADHEIGEMCKLVKEKFQFPVTEEAQNLTQLLDAIKKEVKAAYDEMVRCSEVPKAETPQDTVELGEQRDAARRRFLAVADALNSEKVKLPLKIAFDRAAKLAPSTARPLKAFLSTLNKREGEFPQPAGSVPKLAWLTKVSAAQEHLKSLLEKAVVQGPPRSVIATMILPPGRPNFGPMPAASKVAYDEFVENAQAGLAGCHIFQDVRKEIRDCIHGFESFQNQCRELYDMVGAYAHKSSDLFFKKLMGDEEYTRTLEEVRKARDMTDTVRQRWDKVKELQASIRQLRAQHLRAQAELVLADGNPELQDALRSQISQLKSIPDVEAEVKAHEEEIERYCVRNNMKERFPDLTVDTMRALGCASAAKEKEDEGVLLNPRKRARGKKVKMGVSNLNGADVIVMGDKVEGITAIQFGGKDMIFKHCDISDVNADALFSIYHQHVPPYKAFSNNHGLRSANHRAVGAGVVYDTTATQPLRSFIQNLAERKLLMSSMDMVRRIASQVILGMVYLHSKQPVAVAHLDLNAENVLLDDMLSVHLIGAGLKKPPASSSSTGKKRKSEPTDPSSGVDIQAFGMLLFEMMTGKIGFGDGTLKELVETPLADLVKKGYDASMLNVMRACLDEKIRPASFAEIQKKFNFETITTAFLYDLDPDSEEFKRVEGLFFPGEEKQGSLTRQRAAISRIARVFNEFTEKAYQMEVEKISHDMAGTANERLLFHGTRAAFPASIAKHKMGLSKEFCKAEGFYGKGLYFAELARYAHAYAHKLTYTGFASADASSSSSSSGPMVSGYQLLVFSVALGNSKLFGKEVNKTHSMQQLVEKGHHSVQAGPHLPNRQGDGAGDSILHVIYRDSQCTPRYLIEYSER